MEPRFMKSQIFHGEVFHKRFVPKIHSFKYKGYFFKISLNELNSIENKFFSVNKFNLFSFYYKDHGNKDGSELKSFAEKILQDHQQSMIIDDIVIHTMPRILGYVFNPVSFWYLYTGSELKFIIAEVNNTFGETHSYLLSPKDLSGEKLMQVSPFNQIIGHYEFNFTQKPNFESVGIHYKIASQEIVYANITGSPREWSSTELLKTFLKNPIINIGIVVFIHWQALRLFLKGITFHGKNGVIK
jgi:DUF1365 family protein